jgi:hypothetical protein
MLRVLPLTGEFAGSEFLTTTTNHSDWRNAAAPLDVNADGRVNALDALLIVNALGQGRGGNLAPATGDSKSEMGFVDVNGDGHLMPLDALLVLNHLSRQTSMIAILANKDQDERERDLAEQVDLDLLAVDVAESKSKGRT